MSLLAIVRSEPAPVAPAGFPSRTFDALVFDVDGTLADTEELHRQAFNEAFFACGIDWRWGPALYAELLQITGGKERIAEYISRHQMPASERGRLLRLVPQMHAAKTRIYRELVALGHLHPRPGVVRLMKEARAAGVKLAIASTTSPENVESLLWSSFGIEASRWFSAVATGDVVPRKKPAPDIYNLVLEKLGISPERAIAFERMSPTLRARAMPRQAQWTLVLDQDEPHDVNLRPRFSDEAHMPSLVRLSAAAKPLTAIAAATLKPQKLDPLTVAGDPDYYPSLQAQMNIPATIKQGLHG